MSGIWDSATDWISNLFGSNQNTQLNTVANTLAKYGTQGNNTSTPTFGGNGLPSYVPTGFKPDLLDPYYQSAKALGSNTEPSTDLLNKVMQNIQGILKGSDKESPWDALLKGFTSNPGDTLESLGGIWGAYNKYQLGKQQQQFAEEAFNLQKDNYLNNERRTESLYQNKMANMRSNSL